MNESPQETSDKATREVDALIELIRDGRNDAALKLLNASPWLAMEHSGQFHGVSPLHWAAHRNAVELCRRLIELGADANDSAGDWWLTPLSWGADAGSAEAVELLLANRADVHQDAIVGTTALHAVAMGGSTQGKGDPLAYEQTCEILIANGADVDRPANNGRTPLDDAIENANDSVARILLKYGAQESNSLN